MEKIKILQILEATTGGTRTHLNLLISYLNKNKFDISVICSTLRDPTFQQDIKMMRGLGVSVYQVDMVREVKPWKDFCDFVKIYKIIKSNKYDVVHTHSSKAGVIGRLAAWFARIKVVFYSPHAFAFQEYEKGLKRNILIYIERLMAKITTNNIYCSDSENQISLNDNITPSQKSIILPNAVDEITCDFRSQNRIKEDLGITKTQLVIGTVGNLRYQKGYPILLKAMSIICRRIENVILLIIGDGEKRYEIETLIKALNIEKHVILLKNLTNIYYYYVIMDVFVLTSMWEGMPYSILEAMLLGKPVVATDVPGSRDIVIKNQTGLLVSYNDPYKISNAIILLLKNATLREYFGKNGQKIIYENYLMRDRIVEIENVYQNKVINFNSCKYDLNSL